MRERPNQPLIHNLLGFDVCFDEVYHNLFSPGVNANGFYFGNYFSTLTLVSSVVK